MTTLFPCHAQLDHQRLRACVVNQEMAMEEDATAPLEMRARDGLAPRPIGIERCGPQHDVRAVEGTVALANGHRRLMRVVPDRGESIRLGIEAGNSGAGALRASVGMDLDHASWRLLDASTRYTM